MVDRVREADGEPTFVFKGASSLGIRFGPDARSSKDVDFAYAGAIEDVSQSLKKAAEEPYQNFTVRFLEPEPLVIPWQNVSGVRVEAKLSYSGKPFGTLPLEMVADRATPYDLVPTPSLSQVGVEPEPETLPCLSLSVQIAQKLHACTDPPDGGKINNRVRDVMDLIITRTLAEADLDWQQVRSECERTFEQRDKQVWPPVLRALPGWKQEWARLVEDNEFPIGDLKDALDAGNDIIATIVRNSIKDQRW